MNPLIISTATKAHPLLVRSLDVLQASSALSTRNISDKVVQQASATSRSENQDDGHESC